MGICSVPGCIKDGKATRGFCSQHYPRWKRGLRDAELAAPFVRKKPLVPLRKGKHVNEEIADILDLAKVISIDKILKQISDMELSAVEVGRKFGDPRIIYDLRNGRNANYLTRVRLLCVVSGIDPELIGFQRYSLAQRMFKIVRAGDPEKLRDRVEDAIEVLIMYLDTLDEKSEYLEEVDEDDERCAA